jgi:hypothetical protein
MCLKIYDHEDDLYDNRQTLCLIFLFFFNEVMTERFYVSSCKLEGLYPMGVRVSLTSNLKKLRFAVYKFNGYNRTLTYTLSFKRRMLYTIELYTLYIRVL